MGWILSLLRGSRESKTPDPNGIKYLTPRPTVNYETSASSGLLP